MAVKPTTGDLIGWLNMQAAPDEGRQAVLDEVMDSAIDNIESRVDLPVGTTDSNYPQRIRAAILLEASRLAKRSSSPEGWAGMSDMGVVVRILGNDPDIERLIRRYKKLDGFA